MESLSWRAVNYKGAAGGQSELIKKNCVKCGQKIVNQRIDSMKK